MKTLIPLSLAFALASGLALAEQPSTSDNDQTAELIDSVISAKAIKRNLPRYPVSYARKGREGWVQLSFVIGKDGKPFDVLVIDSEGGKRFESSAVKAVESWSYEPAMKNGEAIEQCRTHVQLDFAISNMPVGHKVKKLIQRGFDQIQSGDKKSLEETVEKLLDEKAHGVRERTYINFFLARYYNFTGDSLNELKYLNRAVPSSRQPAKDTILTEQALLHSLQSLFNIQYQQHMFKDALATYEKVQNIKGDLAAQLTELMTPYVEDINTIVSSDKAFAVDAQVSDRNMWTHSLARSSFSIAEIEGDLETLDIRCENKRNTYTVNDQSNWKIPKSWGSCQVIVHGEEGSSFNLIELPDNT